MMRHDEALGSRAAVLSATCLTTAAGGAMDAWVYMSHGHVFANAQSGNVVLMGVALAEGDGPGAARHLPSLMAFVAGLLASRLSAPALKHAGLDSRSLRLGAECILLLALASVADRLPDGVVTSAVGFVAGVQITSLSHIGGWSFNTGMTTGNLRGAAVALGKAVSGAAEEWPHALAMTALCLAFAIGAGVGAWLTPRLGGFTLMAVAAMIGLAGALAARQPDPLPDWENLR